MRKIPLPKSSRGAFTLVELLVASAISVLLVLLLLSVLQGVSANYTRNQSSVLRMGDTSIALDQIVQDIEGLVIPNFAGAEALKAEPEVVGESPTVWLTLLSTVTDTDDSEPIEFTGATRAISYRIALKNPIDGTSGSESTYGLYRQIQSAKETFDNAMDKADQQLDYWATEGRGTPPATHEELLMVENVVRIGVRFLRADTGEWTMPDQPVRIGRDGCFVWPVGGDSSSEGELVPGGFLRAEVAVTVLSPEGSDRVKGGMPLAEALTRYGHSSIRQTIYF